MATKNSVINSDDTFQIITEAEAPPNPKHTNTKSTANKELFDDRLKQVSDAGGVGRIEITDDNARSIKAALSHAGGRNGYAVNSWNDDNYVYFMATYTGEIRQRKPRAKNAPKEAS